MPGLSRYLDPKVLAKIGRLELKAQAVVEGLITGTHKSPYRGYSVEFAEHREYVPGDELKHVDWKVWSKTDRLFVKQYEEETNLNVLLCVDVSESMSYAGAAAGTGSVTGLSKLDYAACLAASLTWLTLGQQDAAGLALFDESVRRVLPIGSHPGKLIEVCRAIEAITPTAKTEAEPVYRVLAEKMRKRGLVIVISDLLVPADSVMRGLRHFRTRRHEVVVFHVLHPDERTFPFQRLTLFEGMESLPDLLTEPRALRDGYLEALAEFEREIRTGCGKSGIEYRPVSTDQRLDAVLSEFLAKRMSK